MGTERRAYVLDTNVLMYDPSCLTKFEEHDLYLPIEVLHELDKLKSKPGETGYNARQAQKALGDILSQGEPIDGIPLGRGLGKFHILNEAVYGSFIDDSNDDPIYSLVAGFVREYLGLQVSEAYVDNIILRRLGKLQETSHKQVVLVSNDLGIRSLAQIEHGIPAEKYKFGRSQLDLRRYFAQGTGLIDVEPRLIERLYTERSVELPPELRHALSINGYAALQAGQQSVLAKRRGDLLHRLQDFKKGKGIEDIRPRNKEQTYLFDAMLDPEISVVAAIGMAGTGKTLVALAAGLHQVSETGQTYGQKFQRVIVYRPTQEVGKDMGFLPGDVEDKIGPHFEPVKQALRRIVGEDNLFMVLQGKKPLFEFRPINFSRGDTIENCLVIVDEAQNLTPANIKTIGTRMGEGSKIVVTGDPFQVDHPHMDDRNNGLSVLVDNFLGKEVPFFAPVVLTEGERSAIATAFAHHM